jgi:hypothetical protein
MYGAMKSLWDSCVIRREEGNCKHWPEYCDTCSLVRMYLIRLPKCWTLDEMDKDSEDDRKQLSMLVLSHITGKCGSCCLFCEVERIPL